MLQLIPLTFMRRYVLLLTLFTVGAINAQAQNNAAPSASPARTSQTANGNAASTARQQNNSAAFDLSEYGVQIKPEPRLIAVMAALDVAGFDPTPAGVMPTAFRQRVKNDNAALDTALRTRLRAFYEGHKLPAPATAADQAARYVSLAYALGAAPAFDSPARTDDLPAGLLEVLDFAPLMREFYVASGMSARLPEYTKLYAAEGERLARATPEMIRTVLSYLHTRPLTVINERVPARNSSSTNKQKNPQQNFTVRERERRFFIVPDLLAAPGTINFRVIADDYYAIAPPGTNPAASELRRAYLQYVIDPLVLRFSRDISQRREQIKKLLDEKAKTGAPASPDVFLAVTRSLVAASDARIDEAARLSALTRETQEELQRAKTATERASVSKKSQDARTAISDETSAQLADAYDRGAVLAFYFADQLKNVEASGFDVGNFFADMIASFDPAREATRLTETADARRRAQTARENRRAQRSSLINNTESAGATSISPARNAVLVRNLLEADNLLKAKDYRAAERQLQKLLPDFQNEPRLYFALGQTVSVAAADATDEDVQSERLARALERYQMAVKLATVNTDPALLSRAHEAMGRILAFLDRPDEAMKEFDAAIALGKVAGGAYDAADSGKRKLTPPK